MSVDFSEWDLQRALEKREFGDEPDQGDPGDENDYVCNGRCRKGAPDLSCPLHGVGGRA